MLSIDLPENQSFIIKVIGIGGGGCNAVTHMFNQGIKDVNFIICNTDAQSLNLSTVPVKIQLGDTGLGSGSKPDMARSCALEKQDEIREMLKDNTKMLFVTAGMGGGTGTGAAPVIAQIARELDILTVGIVTIPFSFEGRKRKIQAETGIDELKKSVDSLIIIRNDKISELYGNLSVNEAFKKADDILLIAARGIAELVTKPGNINVDFNDIRTIMKDSGTALMGSASAAGENRAIDAVEKALDSPLLNDNSIKGSENILLFIASCDHDIKVDEITDITGYIEQQTGKEAEEIIFGYGKDDSLGDAISVTVIATGFNTGKYNHNTVKTLNEPDFSNIKKTEDKQQIVVDLEPNINEIMLISRTVEETKAPVPDSTPGRIVYNLGDEVPQNLNEPEPVQNNLEGEITEITLKKIINEREIKTPLPESSIENPVELHTFTENQPGNGNDMDRRTDERIRKLREMSIKIRSSRDIHELEITPAFKRQDIELSEPNPASEREGSNFTLSEGKDNNIELKNNTFIHTKVD